MNVRPCALIVEDELFVALDLEDTMVEMGFYVCGVAATQDRAYSLAASEQPDVVLMRSRRHRSRPMPPRGMPSRVVFVTGHTDRATLERIHEEVPGRLC